MGRFVAALLSSVILASCPVAEAQVSVHLRIDHFGYRPAATKTAVLREPAVGWDAPAPFRPSLQLEVIDSAGRPVFAGAAESWHDGAVHEQSGDRAWWFDFSQLSTPGLYRVRDPDSGEISEPFVVADDAYEQLLNQAVRMFYHQRCGTSKQPPYTDARWADAPCHLNARLSTAIDGESAGAAKPRDLSGGWHDAGDYNQYVNFTDDALHSLLEAYARQPSLWGDDLGLPESGNGLPDLLDEIAWGFDWLLSMQLDEGSVLHKVSVSGWDTASPPSADEAPRFYAPASASATISATGAFAHGARVFGAIDHPRAQGLAKALTAAALSAWGWLDGHPQAIPSAYDNAGFVTAVAEDTPDGQQRNHIRAAVHLFALTGEPRFRDAIDAYAANNPYPVSLGEALVWEQPLVTALLEYGDLPGATATVAETWRQQFSAVVNGPAWMAPVSETRDAYRAWLPADYTTWGSNRVRAMGALLRLDLLRFGLAGASAAEQEAAAEDVLHSFHGVNPPGLTYLTNMGAFGSDASVSHTYHSWFDGESDVPPPGYLTGGPNRHYAPDASADTSHLTPPLNQPVLKSYRDWNTGWPENSWEVTECQLRYQATYIELLAHFAGKTSAVSALSGSH